MREHRRVKQQDAVDLLVLNTVARFGGIELSRDAHRTWHRRSRLQSLSGTYTLSAKTYEAVAREVCNEATDSSRL
jgi:hypothetical protein